jgi:hypothetical protein
MEARERSEDPTRLPSPPRTGGRRGAGASVLALQKMAGNQAVAGIMRRTAAQRKPFDDPSFHAVPTGVTAGASALPAGTTTADADSATIKDGMVGGVDRVMLDGLPGTMDDSWGGADRGHVAGVSHGKRGKRGRAIAAVPHGMKGDGPLTLVVHLHGMDVAAGPGTSGMRETGDRPEDVRDFEIEQQLDAYVAKHPEGRVAVLMPLGVTVPGKAAFGINDWDGYVDAALGQLNLSAEAVTVYFSAHSGSGFELSGRLSNPSWGLKTHRLGGVFAFESFHGADIEAWQKIITNHLDADLKELGTRAAGSAEQLNYMRDNGFRFAAFAGSGGYTSNLTTLRKTVLAWFSKHKSALDAATGGNADIRNLLWRNYQVTLDVAGHMQALSANSHFESALESVADRAPAPSASPQLARASAQRRPVSASDPAAVRTLQRDSHAKAKPPPKPPAPSLDELRQAAIAQATLTDDERALVAGEEAAKSDLAAVNAKIAGIEKQRKSHAITKEEAAKATAPLIGERTTATKAVTATAVKVDRRIRAKADMEKALVQAMPDHADDPSQAVAAWFGDIVPDATFMGHPIEAEGSPCPGAHKELVERLKVAENDLKAQSKTPTIHSIGGLRPPSPATGSTLPSYHCFGLAIDIDASANPFVRGDSEPVVQRATLLMTGSEYDPLGAPKDSVRAQWDDMKAASDALAAYFALRGDGAEVKIEAQLQAHPAARATGDAATWKKIIDNDYTNLKPTDTWKHGDPAKGMLSLDRDLVLALTNAGLTWGGMYPNPQNGRDLMHFDWRLGTIRQR